MLDYNQCKDLVEKEIENLNLNTEPNELYQPIEYILSLSGKRIRPALLLMACNIFSDKIDDAIHPALAIEIFHNFTLLHDDIMDSAVLRRNKPTVHVKWDSNVAILSGDAMMIKAFELVTKSKNKNSHQLINEFNKVALEVCEGQQFDMNFEKRTDVSVDEYLNMIRLKTSVLIASSLKMGAILGNAKENDQQLIYDFGLNLGLGFQLQDDLLDTFGECSKFGKKIGGDIVANKKTFLLTTALSLAQDEILAQLKKLITSHEVSREEKVKIVRGIYIQLNIKEITQQKIDSYFQSAISCLNHLSVPEKRLVELKKMVEILTNRFS